MGVTGLWRLIEPAGKPVPVETLENKILAVDISIWLHQMVKGYQDAKGAPIPNAHLIGLFQRLCKLLYFRIKPVFVFDGGFPDLKKETIAKRQDSKNKYNSESERLKRDLALLLSKKNAISSLLGKQISPKKGNVDTGNQDDIFKLPALPDIEKQSDSESEDEQIASGSGVDVHSIDIESSNFKSLPVKEKYDLLIELKETRKMNSWGKLDELPKKSDNFSDFQMQRLLKRKKVQECLQETEKEMGDGGMSLNELESLLNEEGIDTKFDNLPTRRIASDNTTRYLLINNVKQALADAKKKKEYEKENEIKKVDQKEVVNEKPDELEDDLQKAIKMSLECVDEHDISISTSKTNESWTSCLTDSESEDDFTPSDMSSAKAYIMQYTDLSDHAINKMVAKDKKPKKMNSVNIENVLEEINKEKSVIIDNVDVLSDNTDNESDINNDVEVFSNKHKENYLECKDMTQSSVILVENPTQEVYEINSESESNDNECENNVVEKNVILNDKHEENYLESKDMIQSSITLAENPTQEVYDINSKSETSEKDVAKFKVLKTSSKEILDKCRSSDSSDDDFEEVLDKASKTKQVIELTLNMNHSLDNDIFADVFTYNIQPDSEDIGLSEIRDLKVDGQVDNLLKLEDIKHERNYGNKKSNTIETLTSNSKCAEHNQLMAKDLSNPINLNDQIVSDDKKSDLTTIENVPITTNDRAKNLNHNTEKVVSTEIIHEKATLSKDTLTSLERELQGQEDGLLQEKGRLDRIGRNITEQMTKEAQELLQLFGIPYIVAPMEAEAQCAFLEHIQLTDGTITDDSDIWLFGGKTVYKNFFNQKKNVMQFLSERIEKSFNLSREQLILLALLVGSDYTMGVNGVGPVTAMEILASFPFKKHFSKDSSNQTYYMHIITGLQEFKQWVRTGKRTDNTSLKKKLKNIDVMDDFPSIRVVQAYLDPNVEKSNEKFTWGEIDVTVLREYTRAKFGWSQNKFDEIINPVLKRVLDRKTQRSVQDFFKRKIEFQSLEEQMSKRVKAAVQRMGTGEQVNEDVKESDAPNIKAKQKRKKPSDLGADSSLKSKSESSNVKRTRKAKNVVLNEGDMTVVSQILDGKSNNDINIPKSDRYQEIIPQREKVKQGLLQNKLKAIEIFRKTKLDPKKRTVKKKINLTKDEAQLSESSDSD